MLIIRALAIALLVVTASSAGADAVQSELEARKECGAYSQAEMKVCLEKKANASAAELRKIEQRIREAIPKWDEDEQYVERAKVRFDAANRAFGQYRDAQCAFNSSLSGGAAGNSNEIRRLACVHELNQRRVGQLQAAEADLPPKSPKS